MNIPIDELKAILTRPGYISDVDFERCRTAAEEGGRPVFDIIIEREFLTEEQLGKLVADARGYAYVDLRNEKIDEDILKLIPETVARSKRLIAFARNGEEIRVGMVDPDDLEFIHILEKRFRGRVKPFLITEKDWRQAMFEYKPGLKQEADVILGRLRHLAAGDPERDDLNIRLVQLLLEHGYYSGASDLHIEPSADGIAVRYRIDGVMHTALKLPAALSDMALTRVKILAKMRIDEHFAAQDGKFRFETDGKIVDARVSVIPVTKGESIVLRLLSAEHEDLSYETLGLEERDRRRLRESIKSPHGMILVTGPTGSGKTTTVYEILKTLNTDRVHIASIEDPVEYDIEGISQIQVNPKAGLTFAKGLRAIVRQDPDIIFVGEIRDNETAAIAVNSAMTGHLVLSTLHANDAATTLPRLIDMEIEPFLIASTVKIVIAQRLVRKICPKCRYSYVVDDTEAAMINERPALAAAFGKIRQDNAGELMLFKGRGCKVCADTGYSGRLGVFELLELREEVKQLILKRASSDEVRRAADGPDSPTMLEDGIVKALKGMTTLEEVLRVVEIKM